MRDHLSRPASLLALLAAVSAGPAFAQSADLPPVPEKVPQQAVEDPAKLNTLSAGEEAAGWKLLFHGRDFDGWRGVASETIPARRWSVVDGMIFKEDVPEGATLPDGQPVAGGDIITSDTYTNFEMAFDWKVGKGANSGVKYNIKENLTAAGKPARATLGFEYQVIDDRGWAGSALEPDQWAGGLYDLVTPSPAGMSLAAGEWNTSRIVFDGTRIEHWLNGVKVVEADIASPDFKERLASSKFTTIEGFGERRTGHISLQDHNGAYWFRNIRIRELPAR